jgi:hypothetical protein
LLDERRSPELERQYRLLAGRWKETVNYFLTLKESEASRLTLISTDELRVNPEILFQRFRLKENTDMASHEPLGVTNKGRTTSEAWATSLMALNYRLIRDECETIYVRAKARARAELTRE